MAALLLGVVLAGDREPREVALRAGSTAVLLAVGAAILLFLGSAPGAAAAWVGSVGGAYVAGQLGVLGHGGPVRRRFGR